MDTVTTLNPFHFARKGLYQSILYFSDAIEGQVLDVGCGQKPYQALFPCDQYVGLELDSTENRVNKQADYFYDGKVFPFEDASFDAIICNQVLEHVFEPSLFLREISRCLRPGGKLLLSVPFVWDEHEKPQDFARYTSFGLKYLLASFDLEIVEAQKTLGNIQVIFQLLEAYIYKKFMEDKGRLQRGLTTFMIIFPLNCIGEIAGFVLPENEDLYLDNVVLAKKA